jgi:hypothetical protein
MKASKLFKRFLSVNLAFVVIFSLILPLSVKALPLGGDSLNSLYDDTVWYQGVADCSASASPLAGNDNVEKAFNFFLGKGLSAVQAAAIIGNLEQESGQGLNPLSQQFGSKSTTPIPGEGFGIAQWTYPDRQEKLVSYAKAHNGPPGDLAIQLGYLWFELTNDYRGTYEQLRSDKDIVKATTDFMKGYENPGDPQLSNRINFAMAVRDKYGGSAGGSDSVSTDCTVGVSCTNDSAPAADLSQVRQNVVCLARQEHALWKSKSGYDKPYPGFPFAMDGYLKYSDQNREEWCADFVSWVYKQAGYAFTTGDGGWRLAGVSSIQAEGEKDQKFHWHSQSSGYTPKPGDLAIHGSSHVNIFVSYKAGSAEYIGGDQGQPPYPGGSEVSLISGSGYYSDGITGYVSPD